MSSRERLQRGFNRLSLFYDAAVFLFFGRSLWRAQSYFLPALPRFKHALIIGGGTGRILEEMIRLDIADHYYYLDISDRMVKRARLRAERNCKEKITSIIFHTGTVHDLPPGIQFDLVVTPFVLDMFEKDELINEMKAISNKLPSKGIWLFTDFNYPAKKGFSKIIAALLISVLYFFFRIITGVRNRALPGFAAAFSALNFEMTKEKYFLGELLISRVYQRKE